MEELVFLKNGEVVCSSLEVAKRFGKRHQEILYVIEGRKCSCDGKGCKKCNGRGYQQLGILQEDLEINIKSHLSKMFRKSTYTDEGGRKRPLYLMNRDGFTFLVMGFTGKKAIEWKLNYIKAFNTMESIITERHTTAGQIMITQNKENRLKETDEIKRFVEYAKENGSKNADRYYILYSNLANNSLGITDRKLATIAQLNQLTLVENIIAHHIRQGIEQGMYYKDIFKQCKAQVELFINVALLGVKG